QKPLQKRKLNLERMLLRVRPPVVAEDASLLHQCLGQRRIDRHISERRLPLALAVDGGRMTIAGVIGAENDESPGQFGLRVERGSNMSAVHEARVRHDRADEELFRLRLRIRGKARVDLRAQAVGRRFIEAAGDGWRAGGHVTLAENWACTELRS